MHRKYSLSQINSVSGLFPKDNLEWLKWIQAGKTIRLDEKEKIQAIIASQRTTNTVESERIGLNLDLVAKIVKDFENPAIEEEIQNDDNEEVHRWGDGGYSDEELSYYNDPAVAIWGKSMRTKKQRIAFAARMRKSMRFRVNELAEVLGTEIDIIEDNENLSGKKKDAKGWYDLKSGKIVVILGNHKDVGDIEATILHEVVAHHGLRELFGDNFDKFLDAVYEHAENDVKERIDMLAIRNGWNRRVAVEEYLASLAEQTDFEAVERGYPGWLKKIKDLFLKFLQRCGFSVNMTLSDNELRYVLWMSYNNLKNPGAYRSFLGQAERVSKESELKVGKYAEMSDDISAAVAESDNLDEVNDRFNEELERFKAGALDERHRFELGKPSKYLLSAGFPNLPISMRQALLKTKSQQKNHPFASDDLQNLVREIQKPLAIFEYSKANVRNLIVSLERDGKHFLVGVTLGFKKDGLEINSISGLFPKQNHEWIKWIQDGLCVRIDQKEKILNLIDSLRINPAEAKRIGLDLDSVAKVVKDFENPAIEDEIRYRDGDFTSRDKAIAADVYEKMLKRGSWQFHEAMQDSMLGLKSLYEAILTVYKYHDAADIGLQYRSLVNALHDTNVYDNKRVIVRRGKINSSTSKSN